MVLVATDYRNPTQLELNPKNPAQPIPAQDGAEILRTIPGFNVIRKGGTDGDPVFRGMAGSRLGILLDGENLLGGCRNRMDPPTSYVFPGAYDRVVFVRGPQSVRYGAGHSSGTVRFERSPTQFKTFGAEGTTQLTIGAFNRNDQLLDVELGAPKWDARLSLTRTEADDYRDGDGRKVPSAYERRSAHASVAWILTPDHRLELSGVLSDGEAAYADRAMDGVAFDRENIGLKWTHTADNAPGSYAGLETQVYYNYVDHVMDNFSLRRFQPTMMMPNPTVSNPDRKTIGARFTTDWEWDNDLQLHLGLDYLENGHTVRRTMNANVQPISGLSRRKDAEFRQYGIFAELEGTVGMEGNWFTGLRLDQHRARAIDSEEKQIFQELMGKLPKSPLLDIGCGTGHWSRFFIEEGFDVTGFDASEAMLALARSKNPPARFILGNADALPFEDASFGLIASVTMLEFVEDPRRVIDEMHRVLRPGGALLIGALNAYSAIGHHQANDPVFKHAQLFQRDQMETYFAPFKLETVLPGVYLTDDFQLHPADAVGSKINPAFWGIRLSKPVTGTSPSKSATTRFATSTERRSPASWRPLKNAASALNPAP